MIETNKAAVRLALRDWFVAARAGETMSARETAALSADEAAAASSDFFYDLLMKHSEEEVGLEKLKTPSEAPSAPQEARSEADPGQGSDEFF